MTLAEAKKLVTLMGLTLVKIDGEFIVKPKGASNDHPAAYFTTDLTDAVQTAERMYEASRVGAIPDNAILHGDY